MSADAVDVGVELVGTGDTDEEELAYLAGLLRQELLELDVEDVRVARSAAEPPRLAKSGEAIAVGALVVTAAPLLLRQVLKLIDTWLRNRPLRTVKVELDGRSIELSHASREDQQRLIDLFVDAAIDAGE
jgi:membrane-associated two-gene conflict system component 1 (EACC1)